MIVSSFDSTQAACEALAAQVATALREGCAKRGAASLAVPGGRTPVPLFHALRAMVPDWGRIVVTLTDDRCVAPDDPASNARLVRDELLQGAAAHAQFVPLYDGAEDPLRAATQCPALGAVPLPFDAVVLGMGEDGHFASLFAGNAGLAQALDPQAAAGCVAMRAPVAPVQRLSLNLSALHDARRLFLLVTGEAKQSLLQQASLPGHADRWPVGALLSVTRPQVEVFWAA